MRTFWTIVALVLVVGLGIWLYNRHENNLATESGTASSTENQNGIGGPNDNAFDPLNGYTSSSTDANTNSGSDVNYDINGKG